MKSILTFVTAMFVAAVAQAAPETYVIDGAHTFPRFEYSHLGFSIQQSRFDKTSGSVTVDMEAGTGAVEIRIDTRSVNTGSAAFNEHIQTEDFFDTKKYPEILFTSKNFRFEGERLVSLDGELTMKGITKPVSLKVTHFKCMMHPMAKKDACGANAVAQISRTDFNMGKYAPLVSDGVTLTIAIEAIKK
jgi:polyisoprenoid-binding protein YceI